MAPHPPGGPGDAADAPQPMLTVAGVARRLGVAPATLRTWDRRYGLGPSSHTAGAHRRYSPSDLARLVIMRRLTLEGVAPSEAAEIALATNADTPPELATVTPLTLHSADPGRTEAESEDLDDDEPTTASDHTPDRRETGGQDAPDGHRLRPLPSTTSARPDPTGRRRAGPVTLAHTPRSPDAPAVRGLTRAALALDGLECVRMFRDHAARHGVVASWESLASPVLVAIGERWASTGTGIEVEHLLSEAVLTVLREVSGALREPRNVGSVLLACAEGEQHSMPVHVLAAALAEQSIGTRVLGMQVPREALFAAVRRSGPAVVFVYAHLPVREAVAITDLPRLRPAPVLVLGGAGWGPAGTEAVPGARRVGGLIEACEQVVSVVG